MNTLPYYGIFAAMRNNGFSLGIGEYKLLIDVLSDIHYSLPGGKPVSKDVLLEICKTIWLKPGDVPFVFESIFNEHYILTVSPLAGAIEDFDNFDTKDEAPVTDLNTEQVTSLSTSTDDPSTFPTEEHKNNSAAGVRRGFRIELGKGAGVRHNLDAGTKPGIDRRFLFSDNYFPIAPREVEQLFKYLPERRKKKFSLQIDINATIATIAKNGYFLQPDFVKEEEIMNHLVILTDCKGSMEAFDKLSDMISRAAKKIFGETNGAKVAAHQFYFQNSAEEFLYNNKTNTEYISLGDFLRQFNDKKTMIIIISDAGAARGGNSDIRVRTGIRMIRKLQTVSTRLVWLNPMPAKRWVNTSAERVAAFAPMFTATREGLSSAIAVLRGK